MCRECGWSGIEAKRRGNCKSWHRSAWRRVLYNALEGYGTSISLFYVDDKATDEINHERGPTDSSRDREATPAVHGKKCKSSAGWSAVYTSCTRQEVQVFCRVVSCVHQLYTARSASLLQGGQLCTPAVHGKKCKSSAGWSAVYTSCTRQEVQVFCRVVSCVHQLYTARSASLLQGGQLCTPAVHGKKCKSSAGWSAVYTSCTRQEVQVFCRVVSCVHQLYTARSASLPQGGQLCTPAVHGKKCKSSAGWSAVYTSCTRQEVQVFRRVVSCVHQLYTARSASLPQGGQLCTPAVHGKKCKSSAGLSAVYTSCTRQEVQVFRRVVSCVHQLYTARSASLPQGGQLCTPAVHGKKCKSSAGWSAVYTSCTRQEVQVFRRVVSCVHQLYTARSASLPQGGQLCTPAVHGKKCKSSAGWSAVYTSCTRQEVQVFCRVVSCVHQLYTARSASLLQGGQLCTPAVHGKKCKSSAGWSAVYTSCTRQEVQVFCRVVSCVHQLYTARSASLLQGGQLCTPAVHGKKCKSSAGWSAVYTSCTRQEVQVFCRVVSCVHQLYTARSASLLQGGQQCTPPVHGKKCKSSAGWSAVYTSCTRQEVQVFCRVVSCVHQLYTARSASLLQGGQQCTPAVQGKKCKSSAGWSAVYTSCTRQDVQVFRRVVSCVHQLYTARSASLPQGGQLCTPAVHGKKCKSSAGWSAVYTSCTRQEVQVFRRVVSCVHQLYTARSAILPQGGQLCTPAVHGKKCKSSAGWSAVYTSCTRQEVQVFRRVVSCVHQLYTARSASLPQGGQLCTPAVHGKKCKSSAGWSAVYTSCTRQEVQVFRRVVSCVHQLYTARSAILPQGGQLCTPAVHGKKCKSSAGWSAVYTSCTRQEVQVFRRVVSCVHQLYTARSASLPQGGQLCTPAVHGKKCKSSAGWSAVYTSCTRQEVQVFRRVVSCVHQLYTARSASLPQGGQLCTPAVHGKKCKSSAGWSAVYTSCTRQEVQVFRRVVSCVHQLYTARSASLPQVGQLCTPAVHGKKCKSSAGWSAVYTSCTRQEVQVFRRVVSCVHQLYTARSASLPQGGQLCTPAVHGKKCKSSAGWSAVYTSCTRQEVQVFRRVVSCVHQLYTARSASLPQGGQLCTPAVHGKKCKSSAGWSAVYTSCTRQEVQVFRRVVSCVHQLYTARSASLPQGGQLCTPAVHGKKCKSSAGWSAVYTSCTRQEVQVFRRVVSCVHQLYTARSASLLQGGQLCTPAVHGKKCKSSAGWSAVYTSCTRQEVQVFCRVVSCVHQLYTARSASLPQGGQLCTPAVHGKKCKSSAGWSAVYTSCTRQEVQVFRRVVSCVHQLYTARSASLPQGGQLCTPAVHGKKCKSSAGWSVVYTSCTRQEVQVFCRVVSCVHQLYTARSASLLQGGQLCTPAVHGKKCKSSAGWSAVYTSCTRQEVQVFRRVVSCVHQLYTARSASLPQGGQLCTPAVHGKKCKSSAGWSAVYTSCTRQEVQVFCRVVSCVHQLYTARSASLLQGGQLGTPAVHGKKCKSSAGWSAGSASCTRQEVQVFCRVVSCVHQLYTARSASLLQGGQLCTPAVHGKKCKSSAGWSAVSASCTQQEVQVFCRVVSCVHQLYTARSASLLQGGQLCTPAVHGKKCKSSAGWSAVYTSCTRQEVQVFCRVVSCVHQLYTARSASLLQGGQLCTPAVHGKKCKSSAGWSAGYTSCTRQEVQVFCRVVSWVCQLYTARSASLLQGGQLGLVSVVFTFPV